MAADRRAHQSDLSSATRSRHVTLQAIVLL